MKTASTQGDGGFLFVMERPTLKMIYPDRREMIRSQEFTISLGILTGSGGSVEMKRVRLSPERRTQ